jgi:hypothetical protein
MDGMGNLTSHTTKGWLISVPLRNIMDAFNTFLDHYNGQPA